MFTQTSHARDLIGWTNVLATLEHTLSHWLARAVESTPEPTSRVAVPLPLQQFEQRLECLQVYLDRAEQNAEQALAPLTSEIEALRQWLETLNTARGNLMERTALR